MQDQNSAGGTYVNGRHMAATRLIPNDQIAIGSTVMTFRPQMEMLGRRVGAMPWIH